MSDFKKLAQEMGPPDVSPAAMERLAVTMKVTQRRRAEALAHQHPHDLVAALEKVIQSLDTARIQIEDVHSDEGAIHFIEEARAKIIAMLGIDKEG